MLQQLTAPGGVGLHNGKFLFGQPARLVEDFLRNAPLAHVMEQGQGGIKLYLSHSQRRDDSRSGKGTQKLSGQVFKLYAVGSMVHEQLLPAQDSKCGFYIHRTSPQMIDFLIFAGIQANRK